jgi:hypothetical protein
VNHKTPRSKAEFALPIYVLLLAFLEVVVLLRGDGQAREMEVPYDDDYTLCDIDDSGSHAELASRSHK